MNTLSEEAQKTALAKCQELGFDISRGVVPLDKSFINLNEAKDILMNAIKENKLESLPIAIQQALLSNLEAISRFHTNLLAGSDEVVNLVNSIEQLDAALWQYNLRNGSKQLWDYKGKMGQVKQLKLETSKLRNELLTGLERKTELEQLIEELRKNKQSVEETLKLSNENSQKIAEVLGAVTEMQQNASSVLGVIQQHETNSKSVVGESKASRTAISELETEIKKFAGEITEYRETIESTNEKADQIIDRNSKLQEEIVDKLQKATGYSLFATFQTRKNALAKVKWLWAIALAVLIVVSALWSMYLAENTKLFSATFYLKLSMSLPLIYAIWFCTSQYSKERRLEEEYAFRSNISLSLVPYKELLDQMIEMEQAPEREKYTGFIIESLNKIFTSPTDKVYRGDDKVEGFSMRRLRKYLTIIDQISKISKPH